MSLDLNNLKLRLEEEKKKLETELEKIGVKSSKTGWDAAYDKSEGDESILETEADPNDVADNLEELQEREDLVHGPLGMRLQEVNLALKAMSENKYGLCINGLDHNIEEARLQANPAASTCLKHLK